MLDEPARRDRRLERLREELEDAGAEFRIDGANGSVVASIQLGTDADRAASA